MKTLQSTPFRLLQKSLVSFMFLLTIISVTYAQDQIHHSSTMAKNGYWKFRTDYSNRSTMVWFYNGEHQEIYREELTEKYLKPTKRTLRSLDQILARLQDKKIVATTTKPRELSSLSKEKLPVAKVPVKVDNPLPVVPVSMTTSTVLRTTARSSSQLPGLTLWIENPKEEQVSIRLKDEIVGLIYYGSLNVYEEKTQLPIYRVDLNLAALNGSRYKLEVSSASKRYFYLVYVIDEKEGKKIKVQPCE